MELHPGGLNYTLVLQRHAGQTSVLQAPTLGHMRSEDYLTTKIFVDSFLLLLSIMSSNRCSPYVQSACHYCKINPFNVIQDLSAWCHDLNHRQRLFCDNDWLSSFIFPLKSCFISFHFNFSAKIITFHTSPLITNLYLRFWSFHRATHTLLTLIYWCFFVFCHWVTALAGVAFSESFIRGCAVIHTHGS